MYSRKKPTPKTAPTAMCVELTGSPMGSQRNVVAPPAIDLSFGARAGGATMPVQQQIGAKLQAEPGLVGDDEALVSLPAKEI